jgi:hypothetical protein
MNDASSMPRRGSLYVAALCLAAAVAHRLSGEPPAPLHVELSTSLTPAVDLEAGWRDPPPQAKTRCWWWWLNGNVTKAAITRDLEEMHAKGLGGANIIDAGGAEQNDNLPVPHGPDFGSPAWRALFDHALREADRLGLELGLNFQSGWNLGGPTVGPEQAAKKLTWSEAVVEGGGAVRLRLRQPRSIGGYYRDVAVVALPMPANGERQLARVDNGAAKAYYSYPGGFTAVDASHLLDPGSGRPHETAVNPDDVLNLSAAMDSSGQVKWEPPAGRWKLLRIGYTLSGARVSTSSDGWDGWAIDYLDPAAFDQYWQDVVDPILDDAGPLVGRSLKYLHTDSWELGPVNWTPQLPERFAEMRGYKLDQYLPALAGYVVEDRQASTRFLNDFRRTLAELIAENNYAQFSKRAHKRGLGIHPESGGPHAAPVDALLCLGRSDMTMGEFWARAATHRVRDEQRLFIKQPASAAHIYGKRIVMAESFTSIGLHWEEDPRSLKPEFDRVACEGLNLVVLHTLDCSPREMGLPGQSYFAGSHINPNVTWWDMAGGFFSYLNRCQFLLQQGLPVSDVLYFYGENVPSFVRLKRDDPAEVLPGYDYDVINLEALLERTRVEDGRIVLPDGVRYEVLALPRGNAYGLAALEHVAQLVEDGARVVGEKPTRPIGLAGDPADERRFRELADRLWNTTSTAAGDGRCIYDLEARDALVREGVAADFEYKSTAPGAQLDYFHRRTDDADIYFVANRRDRWDAFESSFRVAGRQPELWNPVSGEIADAAAFSQLDRRTVVPLKLPPNGSMFVIFRRGTGDQTRGTSLTNDLLVTPIRSIEGPWQVAFDPAWGGPADITFDRLVDWTDRPEEGVKHYSGKARYRAEFDLPQNRATGAAGVRCFLDLGDVRNLASVSVQRHAVGHRVDGAVPRRNHRRRAGGPQPAKHRSRQPVAQSADRRPAASAQSATHENEHYQVHVREPAAAVRAAGSRTNIANRGAPRGRRRQPNDGINFCNSAPLQTVCGSPKCFVSNHLTDGPTLRRVRFTPIGTLPHQ